MDDFLETVNGRWLLIGSICAFGAALILFIISGCIICRICCKKKKKGLEEARGEEGKKEELDQFLDPAQSEVEDEILHLPDDDVTLKGTFEQVNHVEENEEKESSRRSSSSVIGISATPELTEVPEDVILDVADDVPLQMAAPPSPTMPPRISPPPPATPPRVVTPPLSTPPAEPELPIIKVESDVLEDAPPETEVANVDDSVEVVGAEVHSDTFEELPVVDASSFLTMPGASALPPLDDDRSLGHSMGSTMSLQSMSGMSSSGDGLDDGSPVKGKRKRRNLLKKTTFSKEFSIYASVKLSMHYIESVKCLKGSINSITGLNYSAALIPDDISFHLRFMPSKKFHIMTKYISITKSPSLELDFTMGPVRKDELSENQLRVKLYGRKHKRMSRSSCFGECSFALIDIVDKTEPLEMEMDIRLVHGSSKSNYSSDSDNLN